MGVGVGVGVGVVLVAVGAAAVMAGAVAVMLRRWYPYILLLHQIQPSPPCRNNELLEQGSFCR